MKKFLVFLLVVLGISVACNKEKRYRRYLQGSWKCSMVRFQNVDGFTFFDHTPNGYLTFSGNSVQGLVASDITTFQGNAVDSLDLNGTFMMDLAQSELNWIQNNDTLSNRIFVLTKDNLEFEYFNASANQRLRYVFEKQ
jgi:hypothetical protein